MSASQEKKKRKQDTTVVNKREQREAEMKKAQKTNRRIALITSAVLVVFVAAVVVFSSSWFYRSAKAVKIDNTTYSVADYNFFYYTKYYQYYNNVYTQYGDYASYFLPTEGESLSSQQYSDTETWEEHFKAETDTYLKEITALYNAGKAAGYELPEEAEKEIEETVETAQSNAASAKMSFTEYLANQYGKGMNEKVYRANLERIYYATHYSEETYNSYEYDSAAIQKQYAENKDTYDVFKLNTYLVAPASTETDDEKTAALAEAKTKADAFKQNVLDGAKFVDEAYKLADDDSKETYKDENATLTTVSGDNLSEEYAEWVRGSRKAGEVEVFEAKDQGGYYVVEFLSRNDNSYYMVNVRHILVQPETVDEDQFDSDAEYEKAVNEANEAALAKIEEYKAEWEEDPTEAHFAEMADDYSDDGSEGGLYENVYQGEMVAGFNDWCFDESRKAGDVDIVETSYGYHLIYFVGESDTLYCDYMAETALRNDEYNAWKDGLTGVLTFKHGTFFGLAG